MVVLGILVVLLGTGFVIVSLVVLAWRLQYRLLLRRLRAASRVTVGALPGGARSVLVTGATAPGPAGLLRSPAYDTTCVWFSTDVIQLADEYAPADELRSQSKSVLKRSAGDPIGVSDQTGTVLVDVKLILQGSVNPAIVRRRGEEGLLSRTRGTELSSGLARLEQAGLLPGSAYGIVIKRKLDLRERFIEPGQRVTVLGRPGRGPGGSTVLGRRGAVCTDEPKAWIANLEATVTSDAVMLKLFPVGLVIGAVGVALIVVGVV